MFVSWEKWIELVSQLGARRLNIYEGKGGDTPQQMKEKREWMSKPMTDFLAESLRKK